MTKININFYLRQPKTKGNKAIYATVRYQNETAILYPGKSIHTNDWVSKKGISKPRDIPENYSLKDELYEYEKLIRKTHEELQKQYPDSKVPSWLLKKSVNAKKKNQELSELLPTKDPRVSIVDFFQTLIDDTISRKRVGKDGRALTEGSIDIYKTTKKHFENFQKDRKRFYLEDITQVLVNDFSDYLNLDLAMRLNSSGKYMKCFKTMINYAIQQKLLVSNVLADCKVIISKESPDDIYLTEEEIEEMMRIKTFDTKGHEFVRDLFVIGCWTSLRFGDLIKIFSARVENDFIYAILGKTNTTVVIPQHPIVKALIEKYSNQNKVAKISNQKFNEYIKDIGKTMPSMNIDFEKRHTRSRKSEIIKLKKWELLTAHTCRRTFCTNMFLRNIEPANIMAISGHKSEKTFSLYVKADSLKRAEMVQKAWIHFETKSGLSNN